MHLQILVGAVAEEFGAARPEVGESGDILLGRQGGRLVEVERGHVYSFRVVVGGACRRSAERERESLNPRIVELNLETSVGDGLRLSDQLVQPLFDDRAVGLLVKLTSLSGHGRLPVLRPDSAQ